MKILKHGEVKEVTYTVTCHSCNSILEYNSNDIHSDRDGNYIICPVCKKFIAHGHNDVDFDR